MVSHFLRQMSILVRMSNGSKKERHYAIKKLQELDIGLMETAWGSKILLKMGGRSNTAQ